MERMDEILDFWFGNGANNQKLWFSANLEFDRLCTTLFLTDYKQAKAGSLDHWPNGARTCLALVLLLDQFPRNIFRETPKAFASDEKARDVMRRALACGFDRELPPLQRVFIYMPLEHVRTSPIRRTPFAFSANLPRKVLIVRVF